MKKLLVSLLCVMMVFCMMPTMAFAEGEVTVAATPQGNDFTGYTRADGIWGETWGNATESFVIKILDANDTVMGTTSLNNVGGIIDGDLSVTWSIKLDAASNTDEYWTMEWTTVPSVTNVPSKVELWVDGTKVSGGSVVLNGPDNINPIFAAKTDELGNISSYIPASTGLTSLDEGDNVAILVAGTYSVPTGKDITITGAVDGVVFDNIGACGMNGANVTFNNVTFDYYPNTNYTGLQHSGNLVYNDCTFNGQVFLYGESETFNNCTFNQNSADAYNVWTYGAKKVAFNDCTFNSVGKSVLIYAESEEIFNDVTVSGCDFIASAPVEGKAAIEMDSSLTAGINLTIDSATTAEGFDAGNESGNSLWNNKKGSEEEKNDDITVIVGGETKLEARVNVAKIGDKNYEFLHEAMTAAKSGETVELLCDVDLAGTEWEPVSFAGKFNGNRYAIKNLTINKPGVSCTGFITSLNDTFENVIFTNPTVTGGENTAVVAGRAGGGAALAKDITVNGTIKVETTHSGYARAGVIVGGWGYGKYENITVDGGDKAVSYVKHSGGGDGRYVAGIVGHADDVDSYVNCTVKNITISGGWLCGGIAGPGPSNDIVSGCVVENIDMDADYSGGMFGWYYGDGTIKNSTIKDVTFTGGATNNGAIGGYNENPNATITNVIIENIANAGGKELLPPAAAKIGNNYYGTFEKALNAAAASSGDVTIELLDDVEWETGAAHGSTPLIPEGAAVSKVTIDGKGFYTLTATGSGVGPIRAANGATLEFKNLTIADESESYAEGNWEFGYLEFGGKLAFDNCKFVNAIMIEGETAKFTDCEFNSNKTKEYAVWVNNGTTRFDNCTFEGPRGLKMHEAYGSEVDAVYVEGCTFRNITEKPGIAIGTLNTDTTVMVENSEFINCQPGDQGNYMYETDTDLTILFKQNLVEVENTGNIVAAGKITGGILVDNTATNGEAAICYELLNVGNNSDVKVELYKGTELLMTKSKHFDNGGTITCSLYTVGSSSSWTQEPSPWKAYDCKMPTHAILYINDVEIGKCDVNFDEQEWIDFAGTNAHVYSNGTCTICGEADPNYVPPQAPPAGGGYVSIEKPEITADAGATTELGFLGTTLKITVKEGFELVDVTVNGVSKGAVAELKGLKTGDKVVVTTKAIGAEDPVEETEEVQLVTRSEMSKAKGKKAVKLYWYAEDGSDLNFDGYEIFRSTKRYTGFGKKPIFTTKREVYWNTDIEVGEKYYYRVRAFNVVDGEKEYSDWSLKAWRTVK